MPDVDLYHLLIFLVFSDFGKHIYFENQYVKFK